jgi:hypothetical protein
MMAVTEFGLPALTSRLLPILRRGRWVRGEQVDRIARLPMYDIAEVQQATGPLWMALRPACAREGVPGAPARLTRDLPVISQWRRPTCW